MVWSVCMVLKCCQQSASPGNQLSSLESPLHRHWESPLWQTQCCLSFFTAPGLSSCISAPTGKANTPGLQKKWHCTLRQKKCCYFQSYSVSLKRQGCWHTKAHISDVHSLIIPLFTSLFLRNAFIVLHFYSQWSLMPNLIRTYGMTCILMLQIVSLIFLLFIAK